MSDLAGNPEDRFSDVAAKNSVGIHLELPQWSGVSNIRVLCFKHRTWVRIRTAVLRTSTIFVLEEKEKKNKNKDEFRSSAARVKYAAFIFLLLDIDFGQSSNCLNKTEVNKLSY